MTELPENRPGFDSRHSAARTLLHFREKRFPSKPMTKESRANDILAPKTRKRIEAKVRTQLGSSFSRTSAGFFVLEGDRASVARQPNKRTHSLIPKYDKRSSTHGNHFFPLSEFSRLPSCTKIRPTGHRPEAPVRRSAFRRAIRRCRLSGSFALHELGESRDGAPSECDDLFSPKGDDLPFGGFCGASKSFFGKSIFQKIILSSLVRNGKSCSRLNG